ncbi:cytochrome C biogenesis protein [Sporosarcina sp. P21c]|uniref:cytochrome c biogenesis protein ResB n=1 Tax=unclassified Sporosarcina TaxID=2647733 RepID=UPI000C170AB4|nr:MULTISPECIES: cytochrome c biogenesis protein ResB [unclassified Sporosarcina]PIC68638.1 cytochrome C biogenesis protein [Sporosarcina sp. P16a]PIC84588.1 cytochrome C biogenesis protein [Sporosarcina sp. P1]PIC91176.1 cytochrome C biogenesis protein [Sporosarcina sp. P21c]PIC93691.1 cytochrome C biogenesis protein [Sporosarcina sp. P25]
MSKIKCQCGHENPYGTELCEKCGRPLSEKAKKSDIVDMRYEGSSRRSQTYKSSIVDKIWNFFSSVKIGVSIIAAVLIASAIGTIFPQKFYVPATTPEGYLEYYERLYGTVGKLYYELGLYDMYNSWWFKVLVGMLATSIIIASIDRVVPLYKSLKKQRTRRHPSFMKRQRIFGEGDVQHTEESLVKAAEKLKAMRYNVKTENGAILAEKHRFSRWGPYINHVGLIIFISGILLRGIPGFYVDEAMWLREGETRNIVGAPGYVLENKKFTLENYTKEEAEKVFGEALEKNGAIAKSYTTDVTLYKQEEGALPGSESLKKVEDYSINVNKPLKFDGYNVFQMDYKLNELKNMTFHLVNKSSEESLGEFTVNLSDPEKEYDLGNGSTVNMLGFYPDYDGIKDGEPYSKSPVPNNPAFIFQMNTPDKPKGEKSFVAIRQTLEVEENDYAIKFAAAETRNISGLTIRKDKTLYILLLGGLVFMIGVIQGMYWQHRRVWIQEDTEGHLLIAAHTNKNWFSLRKELDTLRETADLPAYIDRQDPELDKPEQEGDEEIWT